MRTGIRFFALAYLLIAGSGVAWAEPDAAQPLGVASPTVEPLLRMGLAVLAMGIVAWGLGAWARRRRIVRTGSDLRIDVLALRSLGPRQRLALIEVAERRFLVGIGPDQIRAIADLSESVDFERQVAAELDREEAGEPPQILDSIGRFEGLDG